MREDFFSGAVREKAYSVASVQKGEIAADIGADTGFITEGLLKKGLKVIAVDQSKAMLEKMMKKFGDTAVVDYRQGETNQLPIDDQSVDYVFANMYLHHVESPIGKKLMNHIEDVAKKLSPCVIELTSGLRRAKDGSHEFYQSLGYHNVGSMAKLYLRKEV